MLITDSLNNVLSEQGQEKRKSAYAGPGIGVVLWNMDAAFPLTGRDCRAGRSKDAWQGIVHKFRKYRKQGLDF